MDQDEATALLMNLKLKFTEVSTLQGKWDNDKTYTVAPQQALVPLHMLLLAASQSRTLEEAQD